MIFIHFGLVGGDSSSDHSWPILLDDQLIAMSTLAMICQVKIGFRVSPCSHVTFTPFVPHDRRLVASLEELIENNRKSEASIFSSSVSTGSDSAFTNSPMHTQSWWRAETKLYVLFYVDILYITTICIKRHSLREQIRYSLYFLPDICNCTKRRSLHKSSLVEEREETAMHDIHSSGCFTFIYHARDIDFTCAYCSHQSRDSWSLGCGITLRNHLDVDIILS